MSKNGRQGCGKAKTVWQHVFRTRSSEFLSEPLIAIENYPNDCLSVGCVDIAFFHRGPRRKPTALSNIFLQLCEILRIILLHQTISIRPTKVKNIMGIFIEEHEIIFHRLPQVFVYDLRILPSPFRVQVGITHDVKAWLLRQIRLLIRLCQQLREGQKRAEKKRE